MSNFKIYSQVSEYKCPCSRKPFNKFIPTDFDFQLMFRVPVKFWSAGRLDCVGAVEMNRPPSRTRAAICSELLWPGAQPPPLGRAESQGQAEGWGDSMAEKASGGPDWRLGRSKVPCGIGLGAYLTFLCWFRVGCGGKIKERAWPSLARF